MIKPTLGRIVHYHPSTNSNGSGFTPTELCAAIIVHVENDGLVNLTVFDKVGAPHGRTNVLLIQEDNEIPAGGHYCEWMPYQKDVAAGKIPPVLHATPPGGTTITSSPLQPQHGTVSVTGSAPQS